MSSRILLADDSITIQKVVNRAFAEEGIEVVAVSSGDQAERQLPDVNPDLVLADIFMPGKNGYELCESIKDNPKYRHVPVVLLVGAFEPFDQAEARRVRADDHLTKPFEFRALIETVRRLIAGGRPQTGPLPPMPQTRTEEEEMAPLEPRATTPIAAHSFNIDLAAMSEPVSSPQMPAQGQTSKPAAAFDESEPLDVDYPDQEPTMGFGVVDVEIAPEPAAGQTAVFGSPSWMNEMAASPIQLGGYNEPSVAEPLDLGAIDFSTSEIPVHKDMGEREEPLSQTDDEWQEDLSLASTLADESAAVELDFEKSETERPQAVEGALVFEPEPAPLFEVLTETSEPTDSVEAANLDSFKTQRLDSSSSAELEAEFEMDYAARAGAAFSSPEPAEEASDAGLFSVDDPLGDLLADDVPASASSNGSSAHSAVQQPEAPRAALSSSDAFELKFTPAESQASAEPLPMPVDEAPALAEEASTSELEQVVETGPLDYGSEYDILEAPAEPVGWADTGIEVESQTAPESLKEAPPLEEAAASVESARSFTASTMWTEEESRFAPIDIEAVPVDEAAPEAAKAESTIERGFDLASPGAGVVESEAVPVKEQAVSESDAQPSTYTVDLPPAIVDEIVQRVVAQLSEKVVREIAWEVVPDCVERVIERLTREGLAK